MKKFFMVIGIIAVVLVVLSLIVPDKDEDNGASYSYGETGQEDAAVKTVIAESTQKEMEKKGQIGGNDVEIVSAKIAKDYSGKDAIIVTYQWTNNGTKPASFLYEFSAHVYQNGIELSDAYLSDIDAQKSLAKVQPGASCEVQDAYILQDRSDVTVEIGDFADFSDSPEIVRTILVIE